jgi:hypothetical protein
MKSFVFWDISLCSPMEVNRHFTGDDASISNIKGYAKQDTSINKVASTAKHMWRKHRIYTPILPFSSICFLGRTMEADLLPHTQILLSFLLFISWLTLQP